MSGGAVVSASSFASVWTGSQQSAVEEERNWSRKFLEAQSRIRELKEEQDRLLKKLSVLRNSWCGPRDGENAVLYDNPYLISKNARRLELARKELEVAEQALTDLQESLRRSGKPASWQNSKLAIEKPESASVAPVVKDKAYWHKQLSIIDKRYDYLIEPLKVELFELVHFRAPKPGEDLTVTGFGTCLPPFYSELQQQIKELQQQHREERAALMEQARREGALPGWFR